MMAMSEALLNIYKYTLTVCHLIFTELYKISNIIPILLMRELRLREVK